MGQSVFEHPYRDCDYRPWEKKNFWTPEGWHARFGYLNIHLYCSARLVIQYNKSLFQSYFSLINFLTLSKYSCMESLEQEVQSSARFGGWGLQNHAMCGFCCNWNSNHLETFWRVEGPSRALYSVIELLQWAVGSSTGPLWFSLISPINLMEVFV